MNAAQKAGAALARIGSVLRGDGWQNLLSGLGTSRDRAEGAEWVPDDTIDRATLAFLFRSNAIARRIVSVYPAEALRRGWTIDPKVNKLLTRLQVREKFQEAATWGRLYGAGVIVLGIQDGIDDKSKPLRKGGPYRITFLDVYDRRQVERGQTYTDPADRRYGQAKTFRITPVHGNMVEIHRSRCLIFGGAITDNVQRYANAGWDDSVLQTCHRDIRDFDTAYQALGHMLTDASQSVVKMQGFIAAMGAEGAQGSVAQDALATRARLLDLTRSIARTLILDADGGESFEKISTQFSGVPETIDRIANRLSAATEIPVTVLMGQAPAGLAATGDADVRNWYSTVGTYRQHEIQPRLERLLSLMAPEAIETLKWPPLWEPTEKEQAETDKLRADTHAVYIDKDVLLPEEVAEAEFGPEGRKPVVYDPHKPRIHDEPPDESSFAGGP
jgi:phage-related protein (TIGR01555 family)